jgi:tetratricopeptide (TPR) repeat protein/tRNA A-37 threonylcarbamoyl transferase component Bud32
LTEPPNDRIGAYRLVRRLGSGGMGEVFLAWDDRLERPVAAKRMRPDREQGGARRERFRREARSAARLGHPNVVQIHDLVETDDGDWIVMEYVQGRSLADLLRDSGPLPPGVAVDLARQAAEGLAAAHAQGLVHRDLKAENVMVTSAGQAKILDFGLARPLESGTGETLTDDGMVLGTYRSMSPEQAAGGTADARSDLFSLGVLLYEMVAGRSPFQGRSPLETLRNVTASEAEPLGGVRPDLPADLLALVDSLLQKDPNRRPGSAERVARDLRALAAGLPPVEGWAPPPSTASGETETRLNEPIGMRGERLGSSRSWTLPRRSGWIASLVVALAVVAVLGILWTRRARMESEKPLRIAVLPPEIQGSGGEAVDFAAFGILTSLRRVLPSLSHVTLIDSSQFREVRGGIPEIARAVSADEAVATSVEARGGQVWISLKRVRGRDGAVLGEEEIRASLAAEGPLPLARAVAAALRKVYEERGLRSGYPDLEVSAADYAEFLRVRRRIEAGRSAWAPELDHLDRITASSPRFVDGCLQAASLAVNLYDDTKDPAYLERARASLRRARLLGPEMPSVIAAEIRLAGKEGDWAGAEQLLAELERLVPGDVVIPYLRYSLASQRGRLAEAISWMTKVIEVQPSWRYLVALSEMEARTGHLAAARQHLEEAQRLVPGNTWVLAKMGELELAYGDLSRAETIYQKLVASGPQRSDLTNLGLVHFLLGRYAEAADDYRRALAIDPGHVTATLNLADAELALGHRQESAELQRQVLTTLEAKEHGASLLPIERIFRAQCLAYLGEGRKAVDVALSALQESPEDADVIYQTSLVLAIAGEQASALSMVRKALALGYQPRWFTVPAFASLRFDQGFRDLIEQQRLPAAISPPQAGL